MESIDVHDLPEDEAEIVAAFVEFLKQRRQQQSQREQPRRKRPLRAPLLAGLSAKGCL